MSLRQQIECPALSEAETAEHVPESVLTESAPSKNLGSVMMSFTLWFASSPFFVDFSRESWEEIL